MTRGRIQSFRRERWRRCRDLRRSLGAPRHHRRDARPWRASGAARRRAPLFIDPPGYARHRPDETLLYRLVAQHYPEFVAAREAAGRPLPRHVQEEFEAYLKCGRLEHGFLRVRCEDCHAEKLVAFSCKRRGFCPSCGARRMTESAALLADEVLPERPLRQWVLSLPFALRFLLATDPEALTQVLGIVYRAISADVLKKARLARASGATGAVTLIQRFGSALNLNIHFHMLVLDGAYLVGTEPPVFWGSSRRVRRSCKRSSSVWPSASAAHWSARASWFWMPR